MMIRRSMPNAKMLDADLCIDLENEMMLQSWTRFKIASGNEKKWISDNGYCIVRKQDATCLLFVGVFNTEFQFWEKGYKRYWLKSA